MFIVLLFVLTKAMKDASLIGGVSAIFWIFKLWNEYETIAVNRNSPKKRFFGASTGFEPVASALVLQCSTSLSYEDPYTESRPIYWVHQPVKGMKHRISQWLKLRFTAMVTYSFHLYSRSSRHFILFQLFCTVGFCEIEGEPLQNLKRGSNIQRPVLDQVPDMNTITNCKFPNYIIYILFQARHSVGSTICGVNIITT